MNNLIMQLLSSPTPPKPTCRPAFRFHY